MFAGILSVQITTAGEVSGSSSVGLFGQAFLLDEVVLGTVVIVVFCEGDVGGRQAKRFSQSKLHIFGKQFRTGKK